MDKAVQVLVNQCEYLLIAAHGLQDYNPPASGVCDVKPTKACMQVVQCLEAHTKLLVGVTEKHTVEVFFGEVGIRLFNVIIKNIKRMQVSQDGAMQLIWYF
jgi:recyclin-1